MKHGKDLFIDNDALIKFPDNVELGNHVAIDKGFYCTTKLIVGDYVHLAPYSVVIGGKDSLLEMKHFSGIASGGKVVCGGDDFTTGALMNPQVPHKYRDSVSKPVKFEMFSCLGVNSCVLQGVTLAEGSVIGAHSLVTKDTEPWTIYVGSPARPIKKRDNRRAYEYARELGYEL